MGNSFNVKFININTGKLVNYYVQNQPSLKTSLRDALGASLFDGKFSTLSGSDIETFPYSGSTEYWKSVIYMKESLTYGAKAAVFGRDLGNTKYFINTNSNISNKAIFKFPIQKFDDANNHDDSVYPIKILETDTVEISIQSVTRNNYPAFSYDGYTFVPNVPTPDGPKSFYVKTYDTDDLNNMIHSVNIKIKDKTLNTEYTINKICSNAVGGGCRFGAPDSEIIITPLILDNYNPKYVCQNASSSGVTNLYDTGELLQRLPNGETKFDQNPGTLGIFLVSFLSHLYTNNNSDSEYFSPVAYDNADSIESMFLNMYNSNSVYGIRNDTPSYPDVDSLVKYYEMTYNHYAGIEGYVANEVNYSFRINFLYDFDFVVMAKFDDETLKYYIGNILTDYAEPEKEPDKDEELNPKPFEIPDDIKTPKPTVAPEKQSVISRIEGDIDGRDHPDNYDNELLTPSEFTDGLNGWTEQAGAVIQLTHNYHCYIGSQSTISRILDAVTGFCSDDYAKMLCAMLNTFDPSSVFSQIIELPYNLSLLDIHTQNATPMAGAIHVAREEVDITEPQYSNALDVFLSLQAATFNVQANVFRAAIGETQVPIWTRSIGQVVYSPIIIERLVRIDLGTRNIKRIFGNYIDYEMVNYKLQLPLGEIITIDPQILFRDKYGVQTDESDITITGYLDVESGDMLIIVYINDDFFYQTIINVAVTRSAYREDEFGRMRMITQGLSEIAKGLMTIAGAPVYRSSVGRNTRANEGVDTTGTHQETAAADVSDVSSNGEHYSDYTTFIDQENTKWKFNDKYKHAIKDEVNNIWNVYEDGIPIVRPPYSNGRFRHMDSTTDTLHREVTSGHASNTSVLNKFGGYTRSGGKEQNAAITSNPIEGATGVLSGLAKVGGSFTIPSIAITQGKSEGSLKIISNLLPIFIYEYPDIITPNRYDADDVWQHNYNYVMMNGLPSVTLNIGVGYNKYGSINKIDNFKAPGITNNELLHLEDALLQGFYVHDSSNIYLQPSEAWEPYMGKNVKGMDDAVDILENNLNYITLFSIKTGFEKYSDKLFIDGIMTSEFNDCYKCIITDNQNVESPTITIAAQYYKQQNFALFNGRCYKIMNIEYKIGAMCCLYLKEDVLSTWLNRVVVDGIISRSSAYFNSDIHDVIPMTSMKTMKKIIFDDSKPLLNNTHTLIGLSPLKVEIQGGQSNE